MIGGTGLAAGTVGSTAELAAMIAQVTDRKSLAVLGSVNSLWFLVVVPVLWKTQKPIDLDRALDIVKCPQRAEFYLNNATMVEIEVCEMPCGLRTSNWLPRPLPKLEVLWINYHNTNRRFQSRIPAVAERIKQSIASSIHLSKVIIPTHAWGIVEEIGTDFLDHVSLEVDVLPSDIDRDPASNFYLARDILDTCKVSGLEISFFHAEDRDNRQRLSELLIKLASNDTIKSLSVHMCTEPSHNLLQTSSNVTRVNNTLESLELSQFCFPIPFLGRFKSLTMLRIKQTGVPEMPMPMPPQLECLEKVIVRLTIGCNKRFMHYLGLMAPNLRVLECCDCNATDITEFVQAIATNLPSLKSLTIGGFEGWKLADNAFDVLNELGSKLRQLEFLEFLCHGFDSGSGPIVHFDERGLLQSGEEWTPLFPKLGKLSPAFLFENSGGDDNLADSLENHFPKLSKEKRLNDLSCNFDLVKLH